MPITWECTSSPFLSVGSFFRENRDAQAAASLVLTFGNCANLGFLLLRFSLGEEGLQVGAVFLAANTVLLATLGVAIAAGELRPSRAAVAIFKVPWLYAVAAALVVREVPEFPLWLSRASIALKEGALPYLLVLSGLQLAKVDIRRILGGAIGLGVGRLVFASLLAWGLTLFMKVQGTLRKALILEGSVPSAVNAFLLAAQFGRRPDLAAAALFLSTALSAGTLWLTLMGISAWA